MTDNNQAAIERLLASITPGSLINVTWGSGSDGNTLVEGRQENIVVIKPPEGCASGSIAITDRRCGIISAPVAGRTEDGLLQIDLSRCSFEQRRAHYRVEVEIPLVVRSLGQIATETAIAYWHREQTRLAGENHLWSGSDVVDWRGTKRISPRWLSLSGGGLGLECGRPALGELLIAVLFTPEATIAALCATVRTDGPVSGMRFVAVSEMDRAALVRLVDDTDRQLRNFAAY